MPEGSDSQTESLNSEFLSDNTEYRGTDIERESIASQYYNQLNTIQQELINTESPRVFLQTAEDLVKLFPKLYKQFKALPNLFLQSFQDVQAFAERDQKFYDKLDYRAFQKLRDLIGRSGHIIEEIYRQSSAGSEQVNVVAGDKPQRADNLDILRIYRFFGISFDDEAQEEAQAQQLMDQAQSMEFARQNPLFIFKNAEALMRYSTDAPVRAHAALTYLRAAQQDMADLLPTLQFAFKEVFMSNLQDQNVEIAKGDVSSFASRLLDAGAHVSQFCDCNNAVMYALYQMSSDDARLRFAAGFLRSLSAQQPFVGQFAELPHGGQHFAGGIQELDFEYFGRRFSEIFDEVAGKEALDLLREICALLPRTEGYARQNQATLLYALRCYCVYSDLADAEQFLDTFTIEYPAEIRSESQESRQAAEDRRAKAVSRKVAKRDAYYRTDVEFVESSRQEAQIYDQTARLYYGTMLMLAVKYAQKLALAQAVQYLARIGDDAQAKVGTFEASRVIAQIQAMRAAQIQAAQEKNLTQFERESVQKMLVQLQSGEDYAHVRFLKALINANLTELDHAEPELQRPARVLTARLWFERNKDTLQRDNAALLALFGLAETDADLL